MKRSLPRFLFLNLELSFNRTLLCSAMKEKTRPTRSLSLRGDLRRTPRCSKNLRLTQKTRSASSKEDSPRTLSSFDLHQTRKMSSFHNKNPPCSSTLQCFKTKGAHQSCTFSSSRQSSHRTQESCRNPKTAVRS